MFQLPPAPRLSGAILRSVVAAASADPVRRTLAALMRKELGIEALLALPASLRSAQPLSSLPRAARTEHARSSANLDLPRPSKALENSAVWSARYRDGKTKPTQTTERVIAEARRL